MRQELGLATEAMADNFGPHSRKGGGRLEAQQGLGRRGGIRFVDVEPAVKEVKSLSNLPPQLSKAPGVVGKRPGPKGGRPGLGRPWEAEGISRAEYFRRRKKAGGVG